MEIALYIYFALNLFISGMVFERNYNYESHLYTFSVLVLSLLFSTLALVIFYLFYPLLPIIGWCWIEFRFNYRFRFTKYFDDIFLDDEYSEEWVTTAEKLKRTDELSNLGTKQLKRHNRIIQERYGK